MSSSAVPTVTNGVETVAKSDLGDRKDSSVGRATRRAKPHASGKWRRNPIQYVWFPTTDTSDGYFTAGMSTVLKYKLRNLIPKHGKHD